MRQRITRIPKIVTQQRDFAEIDKFMRSVERGEVDEAKDDDSQQWRIVQTTIEKETYCVLNALDGWCECFAEIASAMQDNTYDDAPLKSMISKFRLDQPISYALLCRARAVVSHQRRLYMLAPHSVINSVANALLDREAV
jgi:hypothetical protein